MTSVKTRTRRNVNVNVRDRKYDVAIFFLECKEEIPGNDAARRSTAFLGK